MARILQRVRREGAVDLEAAEFYVRSAVLALGATVLERLLDDVGIGRQGDPRLCAHHHPPRRMDSRGVREKTLQTVLGPVRFARSRYVCPQCGAVEYPGDTLLGVAGTGVSPGLRRLMTRAGARESFGEAAEDLHVYGAIEVDAKAVERVAETTGRLIDDWMKTEASAAVLGVRRPGDSNDPIPILYVALDGTGAPMRPDELKGVRGKGEDGKAKTREVKLGCVFTQTTLDEEGNPRRDPHSTSYVGAIESSSDFGHRLSQEAVRRGRKRAEQTVVLSDGAEYNAAIAREHFPTAIHILDFYHASERLSQFVKDHTAHPAQGPFHKQCYALLDEGRIEELLERMRQEAPCRGLKRKTALKRIAYFDERKDQMRYAAFRQAGFFVGSGVIEAGCKTLIGKRLKQSGMFWSVAGANAIIAARCCIYSGRFEQFWEDTGS
ncbi:MAG: ISKra4 family transposase [Candidatus Sumerlaeota bacterium]|nr:ISKra4 family transposase [Candidatus Sumerlaeota bacterium]